MSLKNQTNLELLIRDLLDKNREISLRMIVEEARLSAASSTDRRAVQRVLSKLVKSGIIQAHGNARARYYIRAQNTAFTPDLSTESKNAFMNIPLSAESLALAQYIAKPIKNRERVSYNSDILKKYEPNNDFYLNASQRKELQELGIVEYIKRPAGTYARNIFNKLLIDLSWNSSRLEGNTYSLLETKRLIEHGETVTGKDAIDAQMILNHKDAIEYIIESSDEEIISVHDIRSIHALLSDNLLGDPSASGRIRQIAVGISGTTYLPLDNPHILNEYLTLFIKKLNAIQDPFEQSFFSLVHLSYLQAFEDVNKRTARLVSNIPLIKNNLKPLSFIDVDQSDYMRSLLGVYEKNDMSLFRDLYLWAYKRSSQRYSSLQQSMGQPNVFKLKYRDIIHKIIRSIIIDKIPGHQVVSTVNRLIDLLDINPSDSSQLFQLIEIEIMSLHEGNVARFKIRPSEFEAWKILQ